MSTIVDIRRLKVHSRSNCAVINCAVKTEGKTERVLLFLRIARVSYGLFMAMRCKLICQRIFRTVGDRRGEI